MAGEFADLGLNTSKVSSAASTASNIGLWIVGLLVLAALAWFVWWWFSHKHIFVGKQLTSGKSVPFTYHARQFKDKRTTAIMWSLRERPLKFIRPPDDVILPYNKKKFWAEGWITENNDVIFSKDPPDLSTEKRTLEPVTANQRVLLVDQIEKAERKRQGGILAKWLPAIVAGTMIIVCLVIIMIFWKDFAEPFNQAIIDNRKTQEIELMNNELEINNTRLQLENTMILREIILKQQVIKPEVIS